MRLEMNEIRGFLYLGSVRAEAVPIEALREVGITHVVQVGTGDFMSPTHADELAYCCVRALDFEAEDLLHKLREAHVHSFIDEARAAGGKVLVHCFDRIPLLYMQVLKSMIRSAYSPYMETMSTLRMAIKQIARDDKLCPAGISRSATTVVSYLMTTEGLSFEDALADVLDKRGCVAPNRGFCDQLRILQDCCDGQLERYRPEMLSEQKEDLSVKQWLAILMRARDRVAASAVSDVFGPPHAESTQDGPKLTLAGFQERLQERKRLARAGEYAGVKPPTDQGESRINEDSVAAAQGLGQKRDAAGEFALELA